MFLFSDKNMTISLYNRKKRVSLHSLFRNDIHGVKSDSRSFKNELIVSGCSAVRLAHLLWEQGVVGSNPATPTKKNQLFTMYVVDS